MTRRPSGCDGTGPPAPPPPPARIRVRLARLPALPGQSPAVRRARASAQARALAEAEARAAGALGGPAPPSAAPGQAAPPGGAPVWGKTPAGAPLLLGAATWHVSISHSGDWLAVAVAGRPVGIDIAPAGRPAPRQVLRRLAPPERRWIEQAGGAAEFDQRFWEVWTMKEAYLKWRGTGMAGGLGSFDTLRPAALGARFGRVGAAAGLVGHVCAALHPPFDLDESHQAGGLAPPPPRAGAGREQGIGLVED
ncbi:MAG: 4'-phosphopantetheinyl transferase superfamily protein [Bifidobacteriaceae bacterium]|jgi:4'-phosphopantetheinyl transferase|nr:4'-phosphopantetheinyl transferase superfamily protein [Bifidobacteriaceae bacterium]